MRFQIGRRSVPTCHFAGRVVAFGETEVDQNAVTGLVVEQEVGWFDVSMYDAASMTVVESSEETTHVFAYVGWI